MSGSGDEPIPVHPRLQFNSLLDGHRIALTDVDDVLFLSVLWKLNGPGHIHAVFVGPAVGEVLAALQASGSVIMQVTLSFEGPIVSRCVVQYPAWNLDRPNELTIDADCIWEGYAYTGIDRIIVSSTSLTEVVDRIFSPNAVPDNNPGVPQQGGRGLLRFTPIVPNVAAAISEDLNAITVADAVQVLVKLLGALAGPEHGYYFADAGGGGGGDPTIYLATAPQGPLLIFGATVPLDRVVHHIPDWRNTYAQFQVTGGPSNHGLPGGFQITGACTFGATFLIAGRVTDDLGGIYGLKPGLAFTPRSPVNIGINDMYMSYDTFTLYCSTAHGCFRGGATGGDLGSWDLLGLYAGPCQSVCADGERVYMVVRDQNGGANGLYTYPDVYAGQQAGQGHDGWSILVPQDIVSCAAASGSVYYVLASDATQVQMYVADGADLLVGGASGGEAITKLITVSFPGNATPLVYALTTASVYVVTGTLMQPITVPGGGSVTNVVAMVGGVAFCTDQGLVSTDARGTTHAQLPNTRIDFAAEGIDFDANNSPRPTTRYAANGTAIYDSNSGGIFWRNVLEQPVTVGAVFGAATGPLARGAYDWISRIGSDGNFYWRLVRRVPPFAPYGNLMFSEVPSAAANGLFTHEEAGQLLVDAIERAADLYATPTTVYELHSWFTDCRSPLVAARPTNVGRFGYHLRACVPFPVVDPGPEVGHVLEHEITIAGSARATTRTLLATKLGQGHYSAEDFAAASAAQFSQSLRPK